MDYPAQYLPFRIDDTWYAVPMEYVSYIIAASEGFLKCSLPKSPPYITRVMSIRKRLIPVIEWDRSGQKIPCGRAAGGIGGK